MHQSRFVRPGRRPGLGGHWSRFQTRIGTNGPRSWHNTFSSGWWLEPGLKVTILSQFEPPTGTKEMPMYICSCPLTPLYFGRPMCGRCAALCFHLLCTPSLRGYYLHRAHFICGTVRRYIILHTSKPVSKPLTASCNPLSADEILSITVPINTR